MLLEERVGQPTTEAEAERLALELYGLHVAAKTLPGEYDDNFHLKTRAVVAGVVPAPAVVTAPSFSTINTKTEEDGSALDLAGSLHTDADLSDENTAVAEVSESAAEVSDAASSESSAPELAWQTPSGTDFVLKVMHPARNSALIDLQVQALQHLAQR